MSDSPQGPGWWQASDGNWYPPEQAPGYTPAGPDASAPGALAGGGAGTDLGSVFTYAWGKFSQSVGEWVVLWLITLGVFVATVIIGIVLSVGSSFGGVSFNAFGLLLGIVFGAVLGILLTAIAKAAVMVVNGQPIDVGAAFKLTPNNLIAGAIFGAAYGLLNAFCGIFGLAAFLFLGWLPVLSAMDDKGADAVGESVNLSTGNPGENMAWMGITWLIGGLICFIGAPIAMIGAVYLLRKQRGEPVA